LVTLLARTDIAGKGTLRAQATKSSNSQAPLEADDLHIGTASTSSVPDRLIAFFITVPKNSLTD
jgi:hypothetical protein